MTFTRGDVQLTAQQNLFVRYAWQVSDFTCEGLLGVIVESVVLGRRRHQAAPLLVGGGAHVGAVAARAERGSRPMDELPLPRARAGRRPAQEAVRRIARANPESDADLHLPEPDRGAPTPINTGTSGRGSSATTCPSRPDSTRGSSAPAVRACRSGSRSVRPTGRGRSPPINRSIRRTSRPSSRWRGR